MVTLARRLIRAREPIAGELDAIPARARPLVAATQPALERTITKGGLWPPSSFQEGSHDRAAQA